MSAVVWGTPGSAELRGCSPLHEYRIGLARGAWSIAIFAGDDYLGTMQTEYPRLAAAVAQAERYDAAAWRRLDERNQ